MAFLNVSSNQRMTMNSSVFYMLSNPNNRNSHIFEHLSTQARRFVSSVRKYVDEARYRNISEQTISVSNKAVNENLEFFHFPNPNVLHTPLLKRNQCLPLRTWSSSPHLDTAVEFICLSSRSQHLFNQVRLFKTFRHKRAVIPEIPTFKNRIRAFFGFGSVGSIPKANASENLKKFQTELQNEHLSSENSQKILMAYVEGYLQAHETLLNKTVIKSPSKGIYILLITCLVGLTCLVIYILGNNVPTIFKPHSFEPQETNTKFSDVKGVYEAKEELKNIVEFLKTPEKFSSLGGKLPKGVLLVGPPGTGKTLLAKAVAGEAGVPFFSTSGSEFDEIYVGVGARRVRELFKLAKENIPCVVFIDEIDSIGKERTSSSLHPHANDTINQLLTEMDGFRKSSGIIVLGATNRREDLDKALLRPGRFDVEITVTLPDYRGRKELLEFYLSQVRHQDADVEKLAKRTTNFTGADIENLVNQAALRAAVLGAQYVKTEHLEYARDKALMGPESMSRISCSKQKYFFV